MDHIKDCKLFLFYGENIGLKNEFKKKIKELYSKEDFINLFQDDVLKNKEILINEIANKSFFVKIRIIFIQHANDKILEILENIIEILDKEKIFVFSDILDRKSKLRSFFEKKIKPPIFWKEKENTLNQAKKWRFRCNKKSFK